MCGTAKQSILRSRPETRSPFCPRYREVEMPDRVVLAIGTKKGLFVAEGSKSRRSFSLRGPFGSGVGVYSALIDTRGTPKLYASSCNSFFGMKVLKSTDMG